MYYANVVRNIRLSNGHLSNVELEHIVRVESSDMCFVYFTLFFTPILVCIFN